MAKITKEQRDDAIAHLRDILSTDAKITFVCTYESRAGFTTHGFRLFVPTPGDHGPEIQEITWFVKRACALGTDRFEDLRVGGCGFSKAQHVTDILRRTLGGDYDAKGYDSATRRYRGLTYTSH